MTIPRLVTLLVLLFVAHPAAAAPKADLWARWTAHDPASTLTLDHTPWNDWLSRHVSVDTDGIARVAYDAVADRDRDALADYLRDMQSVPVSRYRRAEQLAYWINLYNVATVKLIVDRMPVASIRDIDISPGLFSDGPWGKKLLRVEGEDMSLDDIEHRILRPIWRDPRIHYAVNCASLGCPNLQAEAFTAENAERLLNKAAREFVNHPRGARIEDGRLIVSSIYDWFKEDFGGTDAGVIAHLKTYADDGLAGSLTGIDRIADDAYDWSLNGSE